MQITQLCLLYWYVTNKYQTYKSHKSYKSGNQLACRAESHSAVSLLNSHWNIEFKQEFASKTPFKWNSFSNMTSSTFINFTRNKITDKPSISFQMWQISFSGFPIYIRQVSLTVKMWKYDNKKESFHISDLQRSHHEWSQSTSLLSFCSFHKLASSYFRPHWSPTTPSTQKSMILD